VVTFQFERSSRQTNTRPISRLRAAWSSFSRWGLMLAPERNFGLANRCPGAREFLKERHFLEPAEFRIARIIAKQVPRWSAFRIPSMNGISHSTTGRCR
jgi:hypothetical protein